MRVSTLIAIAWMVSSACFAQPANINLSNTSAFEGEPFLTVNPANAQNIVVAWMALDLSTSFRVAIKTKASFNGGATWGSQHIHPHFGAAWHSADVSMAVRPNGTFYLSYVDYREAPDSGGVYITHSVDGGITWTTPVQVINGLTEDTVKRPLDRPWLAVDNSGTANDGMLYITTKPAPWIPAPGNRPYLKTSPDGGQTWSSLRYIDTTGYLVGNLIAQPMAAVAATADGALCTAYPTYLPSQAIYPKILLAKSYSRGATFQYYDLIVNPTGVSDTNYKVGYHLVSNPANANQLAYVYVGNQNGDPDIFATTTNNGGVSWNTSVRVNDDPISNGKSQDMVWASYSGKGDLVVVWRDRRNGTGTGFYQASDTYSAVSINNGSSFQNNIRLSSLTSPFDSILIQSGNDFLGCQLVNDTIYSAWSDIRNGYLNIYFAKTSYVSGTGTDPIPITDQVSPFTIYPNPASKQLFISFNLLQSSEKNVEFKILDVTGKEVLRKLIPGVSSKKDISIDISKLAQGNYVISAISEGRVMYNEKIVIN